MEPSKSMDTDRINQRADVLSVAVLAVCLVVPSVIARVYVRTRIIPYFGIDDVFMILSGIAVVAAAVFSGITVTDGNYGTGQHLNEVNEIELINFFKSVYIWEIGYCVALLFIKLSILTYYNRLQPSLLYKITIAVVVAGSISFLITNILQCIPISSAWDPTASPNGSHSHTCINDVVFTYFSAAFNIITDFWIWGTCLRMLKGLQVATKKKFEIIFIFSIGLLACAASIARLCTIYNFYAVDDKTWAVVPIMTCSFLELALAIVAACLPTIKPGYLKICAWIKQRPLWTTVTEFCSKIPTLHGQRRSGASADGLRRSTDYERKGKASTEPGTSSASPVSRKLSTIRSMIEGDSKNGNKPPILSEIARWGLQDNDFCRDLEMQHELPSSVPERLAERSLSQHYLGNKIA
ncbi:hypothetical protein H072_2381 [Dactylellina haptotyla CBS 200.50]|uniref:Rhodopsin domain-containing protein n=1 Tax=Dactylellina haptotyla (strain CBS 200.50) TaxID=1284197 RepID=S8C781_DACHA|nr:hypothetical protein H072_2381 [Dactylellina haptotyla CBS 200.50]